MTKTSKLETHEFPTLDQHLDARGKLERVTIAAEKRAIARQLAAEMKVKAISKSEMAARMGTSRAQLDRVLNPVSQNVTIETLARAAAVLGRRFHMELR